MKLDRAGKRVAGGFAAVMGCMAMFCLGYYLGYIEYFPQSLTHYLISFVGLTMVTAILSGLALFTEESEGAGI